MSSNNAPNSGASVANRPEELSQWAEEFIATRTREAQEWFDSTTSQTGETLQAIAANPFLRFLNETVGIDWFMAILGEVDLEKVETTVREIQKTYPQERPSEIAHRLLVQQAWEAGKVGFIANIIPPIAAILMGIELAAITRLQAELIVLWDGIERDVLVIATGRRPLLGTALLDEQELVIQFTEGGLVTIDEL